MMLKQYFKIKDYKFVVVFVVSLFVMWLTLYAGNNVVMTDNGDYLRVTGLSSLEQIETGEIKITLRGGNMLANIFDILFNLRGVESYPSSQLIFVRISVVLNIFINYLSGSAVNNYNVYYLGFMCCILYALALSFAITRIPQKNKLMWWIACAVALIIMCDIGYTSYFNSLYAEGLQHILLVALAGFIIQAYYTKPSFKSSALFCICLVLYGTSKPFNIPCAVLIGVVFLTLLYIHNPSCKEKIFNLCAFAMAICILVYSMAIIPRWIGEQTNYNAVFFGVVHNTDDETAREYLDELGVDEDLYVLKNTHYYVSDIQEIEAKYDISSVKELSYVDLVMFHIKHPVYTIKKIPRIVSHSEVLRNIFFMDSAFMKDPWRLTLWSKTRENAGFDTLFTNISVLIAFFALMGICIYRKRQKRLWVVPAMVFLCLGYALILPYVANGDADLTKHMYMFIEFIDIIILYLAFSFADTRRSSALFYSGCVILALLASASFAPRAKTLEFGGYNWYVIDDNENYKTLICADTVAKMEYSTQGNNYYEDSTARSWLNDDFYNSFTDEEKAKLYLAEHKVINSVDYKDKSVKGNRDFYCSAYPKFASEGYTDSYGYIAEDYVTLPNAEHIKLMADKNINVAKPYDYWLETAYFNSGVKARFVNKDGLIYFANVDTKLAIRPVIYLKNK